MPPTVGHVFAKDWFKSIGEILNHIEKNGVGGNPCPQAYLFFTNHPYHYVGEEDVEPSRDFLMTAVSIPTMKINDPQDAREHDPPVFELWDSISKHNTVPHGFE
jgi:hypothetical protein